MRNKFTRRKNDERKVQAASRKALQQISTNMPPTQNTFEELMKVDLPSAWTLSESQQDGTLMYCMLRSDPPTVIRSVTVSSDLHYKFFLVLISVTNFNKYAPNPKYL